MGALRAFQLRKYFQHFNLPFLNQLLLAILVLLVIEVVAFSDKSSTSDETSDVTLKEDDAKSNSQVKAAPRIKVNPGRFMCRPMRRAQVTAILKNKARSLRSLGVRLVEVPRRMRRKLRRFKKITLRRPRHRVRPSLEMCQERPAAVKLISANYANADLAYSTRGVECAESSCNIRIGPGISLTLSGSCVLRSTTVVVPVYNGCTFVPLTLNIGCSCKCRAYNPIG